MPDAADALAAVGVVSFALLLTPQVALNRKRRTTEGMSASLVVLWIAGSVLFAGYLLYEGQSLILVAQMATFTAFGAVLLAQRDLYDGGAGPASASARGVAYAAAGAAAAAAFYYACRASDGRRGASWVAPALGGYLPTVLIVVGFYPQVVEFRTSGNSDGFSSLLSCIDIVGSSSSLAAVLLRKPEAAAAALYAAIVACQLVMLFLAFFVYPKTQARDADGPATSTLLQK